MFGDVDGAPVRLNPYGVVAREEWLRSAARRPEIELDAFIVMPNHVHGIVMITDDAVGAQREGAQRVGAQRVAPLHRAAGSLGSFVAGFKMAVTKRINLLRGTPGGLVWQRNYYERIIREDDEAASVRAYIQDNPARWPEDDYYRP